MKKVITTGLLMVAVLMCYGQQRDTTKRKEGSHEQMRRDIGRRLKVGSAKAERVNKVQEDYKSGMKKVLSEKGLTDHQRHMAVDSLMRQKNSKLGKELTTEQQEKMIPSAERHRGKADQRKTGTNRQ